MGAGRATAVGGACLLAALSCGGDNATSVDGGGGERQLVILTPPGPDIGLAPGGEQQLRVGCAEGSRPAAGVKLQFAIFGDPRGSTLSADNATADGAGEARVVLRAGAVTARFQVRISAPRAQDAVFYVAVSNAGFGALRVRGQYAGAYPESELARVSYRLYGAACATIDPLKPDESVPERVVDGIGPSVTFSALPLDQDMAFVVVASDRALHALAEGCVEVPRGILIPRLDVQVAVPLHDLPLQLWGSYALHSELTLPPRPLSDALRPWSDLGDCPDDPAQLLLDCILDAVDPGDPLDCQISSPSAKTAALLAERGALSGICRGAQTNQGTPALDHKLRAAMQAAGAPTLAALGPIAASASGVLRQLQLQSTLIVLSLSPSGDVSFSHRLDAVRFQRAGAAAEFSVAEVGLAHPLASPVSGTVSSWQLKIDDHSLSLRYGLLARGALGKLVLGPAGLAETSSALTAQLAELVKQPSGPTVLVGCPAIEAIACDAAHLPSGCLGTACPAGVAALATYLDAGFAQIDARAPAAAAAADLAWRGEAQLFDDTGDLLVDALGKTATPGIWKARLQMGTESVTPEESTFVGQQP